MTKDVTEAIAAFIIDLGEILLTAWLQALSLNISG